eukprot:scaffold78345_cov19-Tisochrysis_lutea.AAC.2
MISSPAPHASVWNSEGGYYQVAAHYRRALPVKPAVSAGPGHRAGGSSDDEDWAANAKKGGKGGKGGKGSGKVSLCVAARSPKQPGAAQKRWSLGPLL